MNMTVKNKYEGKTLRQLGKQLKKNVLGPFVYVFFILAMEVCYGIVTYGPFLYHPGKKRCKVTL